MATISSEVEEFVTSALKQSEATETVRSSQVPEGRETRSRAPGSLPTASSASSSNSQSSSSERSRERETRTRGNTASTTSSSSNDDSSPTPQTSPTETATSSSSSQNVTLKSQSDSITTPSSITSSAITSNTSLSSITTASSSTVSQTSSSSQSSNTSGGAPNMTAAIAVGSVLGAAAFLTALWIIFRHFKPIRSRWDAWKDRRRDERTYRKALDGMSSPSGSGESGGKPMSKDRRSYLARTVYWTGENTEPQMETRAGLGLGRVSMLRERALASETEQAAPRPWVPPTHIGRAVS